MHRLSRLVLRCAYAGAAVTMLAQAADITKPNIKSGLWEVTSNPQISGELPISDEQIAQMPPDKRAKFEAMLRAGMKSAASPHVYKECMTPEKLARGFESEQHGDAASCDRQVVTSTANELQLHDVCTKNSGKTVTDVHFQISRAVNMTGTISAVITSNGKTMTVTSSLQGKWLTADCGNIKDSEMEK
jgi:Protein of unknown function (DUF3617)